MRFSPARFVSLATLVPTLLLLVVVPGCAKQSEGERCGEELGSASDVCGDGLTCTSGIGLINKGGGVNRCCYSDGHVTDSRCERGGDEPEPGTSGSGGSAGSTTVGGASSGGSVAGGGAESGGSSGEAN